MRDLRSDVAAACSAVVDRVETGNVTAGNVEAAAHDVATATSSVDANVSDLASRASAVMAGTDGAALHATLDNPPDASAAVAATTDVGSVLHTDLWFVIGLVASLLGSFALYRLVMPRA